MIGRQEVVRKTFLSFSPLFSMLKRINKGAYHQLEKQADKIFTLLPLLQTQSSSSVADSLPFPSASNSRNKQISSYGLPHHPMPLSQQPIPIVITETLSSPPGKQTEQERK